MTVQPCRCIGDTRSAVAMMAKGSTIGTPEARGRAIAAREHALASTLAESVAPSASTE